MDEFVKKVLEEKQKEVEIARYFLLKSIGKPEPYNEEFESKEEDMQDYRSKLFMHTYKFKENFFRTIGLNPFEYQTTDYPDEALQYLNSSYPFCFNVQLSNDLMGMEDNTTSLYFYAMCLGATDEQLEGIEEALREQPLKLIPTSGEVKIVEIDDVKTEVDLSQICGSTVKKYMGDTLLDVYNKVDDKNMNQFVSYLLRSGAMSSNKAFNGIIVSIDDVGNLFVSEGNHRIMAYKAIKAVKELVTGEKEEGIKMDVNLVRIRYREDSEPDFI